MIDTSERNEDFYRRRIEGHDPETQVRILMFHCLRLEGLVSDWIQMWRQAKKDAASKRESEI